LHLTGTEPHVLIHDAPRFESRSPKTLEIHADSLETGIMSKFFPRQVDIEMANTLKSTDLTLEELMIWRRGWSDARNVTPLGYFGDPAGFDADAAEEFIEVLSTANAGVIQSLIEGRYRPPGLKPG
jgi:creatinine amidohydrolase